jgi:hypothetical protein
MSFATSASSLRQRFYVQWNGATDVAWPNVEYEPTTGSAWVRVSPGLGDSFQPYLGLTSRTRTAGLFIAEIFEPPDSGDAAGWAKADTIAGIFRRADFDGFKFGEPSAMETTLPEAEPWFRITVEAPYYRHWSPSEVDELASYPTLNVTQAAHGFVVGEWLSQEAGTWAKAQADAAATLSYPAVVTRVIDTTEFQVTLPGGKANLPSHGLGLGGTKVWLSQATAGADTVTEPSTGLAQQVAKVWDADHLIVMDYQPVDKG